MSTNIITIFEIIRDIPYEIGPLHEGEYLVKYGKGGCGPKNRLLAKKLAEMGYKVKVCQTPYSWKNVSILPKDIRKHPSAQRIGNHVYLKVLIKNQWIILDASWDKKLYPVLPANINWDGKSNQICALPITDEKCFDYPEPYLSCRRSTQNTIIRNSDRDFAKIINNFFDLIRNNH